MAKIIQKENKILRQKAKEVPLGKISSPEIQKILKDMKKALSTQEDGVAIAAPQIGVSLRIFVVSGRALAIVQGKDEAEAKPDTVYINPKITKLSQDKEFMEEGCLSVRWYYGKVKRSKKAYVEAYDENGKAFKKGASGVLAQVFQHEIDHLDGVLFIDKAKDLEEIPPEKITRKNS